GRVVGLRGAGGETPLMHAVLYGDLESVRMLLDRGADPNARSDSGATALLWAVNDLDKTRLLLEYGADVNARSDNDRTAIVVAAGRHGATPVIRLLLDYGATPLDKAAGTHTLFESLFSAADADVFRTLVAAGADAGQAGVGTILYALSNGCDACAEQIASKMDRAKLDEGLIFAAPPIGDARAM